MAIQAKDVAVPTTSKIAAEAIAARVKIPGRSLGVRVRRTKRLRISA
uniref:Uncharacterized protein n=1 Tax=uncultured alpha proteobacterium EF100_102A06 TaxID=710799 RepID=E0Y2A2_9PROT|nr:hypothetical protein [uncultured alpha proteobacterium EF100_102A06]